MDCTNIEQKKEEDFATEWNKEMTLEERVALLAKTFDNKEKRICIECKIPGEKFYKDEPVCQDCTYETVEEREARVKAYYNEDEEEEEEDA